MIADLGVLSRLEVERRRSSLPFVLRRRSVNWEGQPSKNPSTLTLRLNSLSAAVRGCAAAIVTLPAQQLWSSNHSYPESASPSGTGADSPNRLRG